MLKPSVPSVQVQTMLDLSDGLYQMKRIQSSLSSLPSGKARDKLESMVTAYLSDAQTYADLEKSNTILEQKLEQSETALYEISSRGFDAEETVVSRQQKGSRLVWFLLGLAVGYTLVRATLY